CVNDAQMMYKCRVDTLISAIAGDTAAACYGVSQHGEQQNDPFRHFHYRRGLVEQEEAVEEATHNQRAEYHAPDGAAAAEQTDAADDGRCDGVEEEGLIHLSGCGDLA